MSLLLDVLTTVGIFAVLIAVVAGAILGQDIYRIKRGIRNGK